MPIEIKRYTMDEWYKKHEEEEKQREEKQRRDREETILYGEPGMWFLESEEVEEENE